MHECGVVGGRGFVPRLEAGIQRTRVFAQSADVAGGPAEPAGGLEVAGESLVSLFRFPQVILEVR